MNQNKNPYWCKFSVDANISLVSAFETSDGLSTRDGGREFGRGSLEGVADCANVALDVNVVDLTMNVIFKICDLEENNLFYLFWTTIF